MTFLVLKPLSLILVVYLISYESGRWDRTCLFYFQRFRGQLISDLGSWMGPFLWLGIPCLQIVDETTWLPW
ncbi:hypothetical protein BDV35DRAFT_268585 [Aspergillus flavus]|uniref:Uncharacterized protein n=1 Tax=Aspergillus flavus TaxID=5059 RepID=A0A5N6GUA3_ASPFL|nr:hypothetical protein BDV35DRAFT_268585 [Aspergillus flavus]